MEAAIFERFHLDLNARPEVKQADLRVLAAEQAQVMPEGTDYWTVPSRIKPAAIDVQFLSPTESSERFLSKFFELTDESGAL
ncbi:hypothetical protein [Rhizobium sp. BE258]|uniref:hypothetical protein n=1 Tax=Rhizobium sp. BE258 TaxID=2817722 RepID=UPI00285DF0A1|nr:hypothetical protein [Rhizobium sp. BE258]MDR7147801.1 hypothetical protein [Rhizobium sp. BE258]